MNVQTSDRRSRSVFCRLGRPSNGLGHRMHTGLSALTTERASVPYATTTDGRRVTRRRIDRSEMQGETNCSMYRTLGAHPDVVDGAAGTRFAVWAPNAAEVSVVCNANGWKPGQSKLWGSDSGIWSGFVPGVKHGDVYKYVLRTRDGRTLEKYDPVAFYAEVPPHSASVVYQLPDFPWQDGAWLHKRAHTNWFEQPIAIYEVHLGSWKRPKDGRRYLNYREMAKQL